MHRIVTTSLLLAGFLWLTPGAPAEEVKLFNGKDLTGWVGSVNGYGVEEIDAMRGLIPRSAIVEALLQLALRRVRRHRQSHISPALPYGESPRSKEDDGYDEYWDERHIFADP